ncbi:hypothetical protein AB664_06865 [Brucella anthropi]|uniref:ABC transporter domain-containing protein n=1 Tax=Brucella anthropi TaxID=529 RepID=A0A656Z4D7_BRUAN|nr:hypothetical protein AB664_06865 [Brucella anthropi]
MFGETAAISGVSLSVARGEILGIIGRSGAGKSTLIRCVNGLEKPDSGSILIEGREITGLGEDALRPVRPASAWCFSTSISCRPKPWRRT